MKQPIRIDTLQWFIGIYIVVRGMLMLMLPHTLKTHVFVAIQAQLPWLGAWQVIAGVTLIMAITLLPRRLFLMAAHLMVAFALFQVARGHFLANTWTALVDFSLLGIGIAIAPLIPSSWRLSLPRQIDLFAFIMATRSLLDGLIVLAPFNPQFEAHLYDPVRPYLLWYGIGYLVGGLALFAAYFYPKTPPWCFRCAHLIAGGVMWAWTIGLGAPTWNSVLYYGGLGSLLALLPWLSPWLRRVDPGSLQTQLAVTLVSVVVLPLLTAVTLVTLPQEQTVIQQALALQQTLAKALSQDIASYVSLHRAAVHALAQQPNLASMSPTEQRNFLRLINQTYTDFVVLATYDAGGNAIARSDNRPLGPSIADRSSFQTARRTGEPTLSIRVGRVIGKPVFVFLSPLYTRNREFAGVVSGAIEATEVTKQLVETSGTANLKAYLVDDLGRVVAHPNTALVNEFADYSASPPVAAVLNPTTGYGGIHYWDSSSWQLAGYAHVPKLGWGVIVERPVADVLRALNTRRNRDFVTLIIIATIALLIGLLIARRLTKPLSTLAYATEQLALGDRQAPLPRSRITEVAHLSHAFGTMRDRLIARTAERDQAEVELRQSEAKMRRLVESNVIGVILADLNGSVLEANDAFLQIIGYTREDLRCNRIGWKTMTPPEFRAISQHSVHELKTQGVCTPFEKEYIRKDGSRVPVLMGCALIEEASNQVIGFVLDLTERKQMEQEREQLLTRERLAREQAESANRIKDEFLAVLSHELRSPLNPILGWAKLLQTREFDKPTLQKAFATIERNANLQSQLIEDLLDVSRILRGKLSLTMVRIDLASVIQASIETVQAAAFAKNITIQTQLDTQAGHVLGDKTRLQQIVWNLLSNAVKFTDPAGRIEVCLTQVGSDALITVQDTGRGISQEFLPYVFDYFRQADSTTTRRFGGLGLGLAIVRHLVELHGGTVWAESAGEGQGATFTVKLPVLCELKQEFDGPSDITSFAADLALHGIHALVVDDEDDSRDFVCYVLEQAGATVTTASSAVFALQLLEHTKADVLLSDIGMPEVNGYMLMQQVRSQEAQQAKTPLPALALTAYAGEYDQKQALEAGFQLHLSKPVDPEALVRAIAKLVMIPTPSSIGASR
ncbi:MULTISPECIES: ATP-binding protein [unclassified Leptolyngbya]|uniref:hybrid sensor histidine kinase/response regulator n=1 Tax=unclassified Leptolyngbya TaxID=2650499 RepID=UPI001682EF7C|nr:MULTISPECIES: ATP-binding protein [unclassified Leptolyngbya]MBD1913959.1 response regulator [Leptolyngbya sp. FACHB-8]MBD2155926.1 response regulator [Leptolyngbya sp. FACHB-16]